MQEYKDKNWTKFLKEKIKKTIEENLFRTRKIIEKKDTRNLIFRKKKYINFSNNDYLGLSRNRNIIKSWKNGLNQFGCSSSSSGHMTGYSSIHHNTEKKLANWLGYQKALLFPSGYIANQSIILSLMQKNDLIVADRLSHSSIIESGILSPAVFKRFSHNNINSLKLILNYKKNYKKTLVVTEGVFSMNGDMAPIKKINKISKKKNAILLIDDAHGIGVIGDEGKGSCSLEKTKPELLVITFGKAFGVQGAALLCQEVMLEYMLQYNKHLIFSTYISSAQAAAISESINQIRKSNELRTKLNENIKYFRKLTKFYKFPFLNSKTAIQILPIGENKACLKLSEFLYKKNIWVQAIRHPTVPKNNSIIRISISAKHKLNDINLLMESLDEFYKKEKNK